MRNNFGGLLLVFAGFVVRADAAENRFFYQASYLHSDQYDKNTGYNTGSDGVTQILSYRLDPKLSLGGSLTFNASKGDKTGEGRNDLDVWGGSGFASRSLAPGLTLTGLLGYYKGDGSLSLASSPSVSDGLGNSVFVVVAALDQFVPLAERLNAHVGAQVSGIRNRTEETHLPSSTVPSRTNEYATMGLGGGADYRLYRDFYSGLDLRISHEEDRSAGGYLALQPELSIDWYPAKERYGARVLYGLVSGQQRKSYFGGFSLGCFF